MNNSHTFRSFSSRTPARALIALTAILEPSRRLLHRGHRLLALVAVSALLLTLVACGSDESAPATSSAPTPTGNTPTVDSPTTTAGRDTPTEVPPTATQVPDARGGSGMSLHDYLAICGLGKTEAAEVDELPLKEIADSFRGQAGRLESVEPPVEVAHWHEVIVEYQKTVAEAIEAYLNDPKGQSGDEFLFATMVSLALEHQPAIDGAIGGMAPDVRSRMAAAGCIDEEIVGVTPSEDTGPAPSESEEMRVGSSVSGSLDEPEETDRFHFQAEAGEYYVIEVNWQDIPRLRLRLFQAPGYNWTFDSEIPPISERWTPDVSGTINISVSAWDATGVYVLSISPDPTPQVPANLRASWEGEGVRLSWDPAAGAEYYNVYYHVRPIRCSIDPDGNPSRCMRLADNVVDTSYFHEPVLEEKISYWVAACNSEGCSEVDTENPAVLTAN